MIFKTTQIQKLIGNICYYLFFQAIDILLNNWDFILPLAPFYGKND
jgi:hypothetical protein